jgi:hypothetical protein
VPKQRGANDEIGKQLERFIAMQLLIARQMTGYQSPDFALIDAVAETDGSDRDVSLYFDRAVDASLIRPPVTATLQKANSIGNATVLTYRMPTETSPVFSFAGNEVPLEFATTERSLFRGKNAIAAVRNGEDLQTVVDWLTWHQSACDMDVAVILDRATPETAGVFAKELDAKLLEKDLQCQVLHLTANMPLGKREMPAEAHPFCAPEAPGKDRMDIPEASPQDAPLGTFNIYELIRTRFLGEARAVANIDINDLIVANQPNVFDAACAAPQGVIRLDGRHCYPWRVRKRKAPRFADHICTQFDTPISRSRWCVAPQSAPEESVWRLLRIEAAVADPARTQRFYRYMALRHEADSISQIVPKTSLIESRELLEQSETIWDYKPVRMPKMRLEKKTGNQGRRAVVTAMKNEGPFILEWVAYNRAIGFDDILVYTNDCSDGTDELLKLLQSKGIVQHRENRFREMGLKPQHAALQSAEIEPMIQQAAWVACIDVDEYINIKCGDGTLDALFKAVPDANMIAMTWRLFGNGDQDRFEDRPVIEQFNRCAPELTRKPHQAWGFKTLFQTLGIFKKLGVHRPKGLNPQLWESINWVNGSGKPMPRTMFRNGWRSTTATYGYDLVQLNHYAIRSTESFLVKRDRGRVNHVDRDQGLAYWFRMNHNSDTDDSIKRMVPRMREELARLMADPDIRAAHEYCVSCHRAKIAELQEKPDYAEFYASLRSSRMRKLCRLQGHFGSNVFLAGPDVIPDEIVAKDPEAEWFFTVDRVGEAKH